MTATTIAVGNLFRSSAGILDTPNFCYNLAMTSLIIRQRGKEDYPSAWEAMRLFTDNRTPKTPDELWLLEHSPVFTQGQAGKPEHILNPGDIPVIQTDRGGQVTYHGPGQLMVYCLFNLNRLNIGPRQLVTLLENTVIALLADYQIIGSTRCHAPGIYVNEAKICSIGLRVRKGYSYHGLALNIDMDLEPFSRINPCGFANLPMTQMREFIHKPDKQEIQNKLVEHLVSYFGYNEPRLVRS